MSSNLKLESIVGAASGVLIVHGGSIRGYARLDAIQNAVEEAVTTYGEDRDWAKMRSADIAAIVTEMLRNATV